MTPERTKELLHILAGYLSVEPGIRKRDIWEEVKEVLEDSGAGEGIATHDERCDIALEACDPAGWHGQNCAVHVKREGVMENPPGKFQPSDSDKDDIKQ